MRCSLPGRQAGQVWGVTSPVWKLQPNPRLTRRGHTWLQPVKEKRQRSRNISSDAAQVPDRQQIPSGPASPRKPALHPTPLPRAVMGALAATWRPPALLLLPATPPRHHICPSSPQVCKLMPLTPTVQDASSSCCPLEPRPTQRTGLYPQTSEYLHGAGIPSRGPLGPGPQGPASAVAPSLAHTPIGSFLHTPGCFTPACRGRPPSPGLRGLLRPVCSSAPCLGRRVGGRRLLCLRLPGPSSLESAPLSAPILH